MSRAGAPATVCSAGTSLDTTEDVSTIERRPIVSPGETTL